MVDFPNLEEVINSLSFQAVGLASVLILILVGISLKLKKPSANVKIILFTLIASITGVTTLFLAGSTLYLNVTSSSKGPVHWHADIEIWKCGQEINLKDPSGISNKIGTSTLHEHNDKRIHLEGVVINPHDASLGKFFKVIGGELSSDRLQVPTNENLETIASGDTCPDANNAQLQVFVYKVTGHDFHQEKLLDPGSYIISPYSNVPSGDCIIIELDGEKDKTDKLCRSFQVAQTVNKLNKPGN